MFFPEQITPRQRKSKSIIIKRKESIMRTSVLFFFAIFVFVSGCAELDAFEMTEKLQAEQAAQFRYLSVETADGRASFEVIAPSEYAFNAVVINPGNVIADALYKEIVKFSSGLAVPAKRSPFRDRPKSETADYMLVFTFEKAKKHDGYVLIINAESTSKTAWREKVLAAKTYHRVVDMHFSCAGDMADACSRKLADATVEGTMSTVKRFVKDIDNLP
jgi:hypothetical protein